jgi:RNA polymerase sigma-70 factor (ECF subfamily)
MNPDDNPWITRQTLIQRAKNPNDPLAWKDFDAYYRNFISLVITKLNVPSADRDDLTQEVLLKVWKSLEKMIPNKNNAKFRTWLSTIIRNTVIDYFKKNKNKKTISIDEHNISISIPSNIETMINDQWETHLSRLAIERVSKKFSGNAMEVFTQSYTGKSTEEISENLNISVDTVYVLKNRVKNKLLIEIKNLQKELEFE